MFSRTKKGIAALSLIIPLALPLVTHGGEYEIVDLGEGYASAINDRGDVITVFNGITYYYDGKEKVSLGTLGTATISGTGINNLGEVVGIYRPAGSFYDTSIAYYDGQAWKLIGKLGAQTAVPAAINDNGLVAGTYYPAGSGNRAFIYNINLGTVNDLPSYSTAHAINANGWITGTYKTPDSYDHTYYYDGIAKHEIPRLGALMPWGHFGYAINDSGNVVGQSRTAANEGHAFFYNRVTIKDLGTLGGRTSQANAVNNFNLVVGYSLDINGQSRAFLHDGGAMHDLNALVRNKENWILTSARDINDGGMIVGVGTYGGIPHAVLLSPVVDLRVIPGDFAYPNNQPFTVPVSIANIGSSVAPNVTLRIPISTDLTLRSVQPADMCVVESNEVTCTFPRIAAGALALAQVTLEPLPPGRYSLEAHVTSRGSEANPGDNIATYTFNTINTSPTLTISTPIDLLTAGAPVTLTGAATDPEDGDITGKIRWDSGPNVLGFGGQISAIFPAGTHTVSASVTDSSGAVTTKRIQLKVDPVPVITLEVSVSGNGAYKTATLTWSGARVPVDIYQDGALAGSGPVEGDVSIDYKKEATSKVCERGTSYCSNVVKIEFDPNKNKPALFVQTNK